MTPKGAAFLALWNDFDPARDDEYNCWHTFEHVPERVGIAGILSARRYLAAERGEHRYFTLYDLASLATLEGGEYLDVAERPTAWSLSMRPSFRNFLRRPCASVLRVGRGIGCCIATFRFALPAPLVVDAWSAMLAARLESSGVPAIELGRTDTDARFPLRNAVEDDAADGAPHVLLVEGTDRAALEAAGGGIADSLRGDHGARALSWEAYDFAFAIDRDGLPGPLGTRQAPREDLRRRWQAK